MTWWLWKLPIRCVVTLYFWNLGQSPRRSLSNLLQLFPQCYSQRGAQCHHNPWCIINLSLGSVTQRLPENRAVKEKLPVFKYQGQSGIFQARQLITMFPPNHGIAHLLAWLTVWLLSLSPVLPSGVGLICTLVSHGFCTFQCFLPVGRILVSTFPLGS